MFPLRDDNPTRSTPVVTFILIAINLAIFLWQWLVVGLDRSAIMYGLIPAELVHGADATYTGKRFDLPPGMGLTNMDPAWATVLTSMFMHGSWLHVLSNMWYLWVFGNNVEDSMGKGKFIAFYLVCGVAAAAAQVIMGTTSQIPMVGASGAVAGILGAYLYLYPGSRVHSLVTLGFFITTMELPAWIVLGLWFVLQFVSHLGAIGDTAGGVAYAAHVGGFVVGWLLVRLVGAERHEPHNRQYEYRRATDHYDWR